MVTARRERPGRGRVQGCADSLLVVFDTLESQFESIYGDKATERAKVFTDGLRVVAFGENGVMYYYPVDFSMEIDLICEILCKNNAGGFSDLPAYS